MFRSSSGTLFLRLACTLQDINAGACNGSLELHSVCIKPKSRSATKSICRRINSCRKRRINANDARITSRSKDCFFNLPESGEANRAECRNNPV